MAESRPVSDSRRLELLAELETVGSLQSDEVFLPGTDVSLRIARPADFDRLLDAAASDPEQNLPYWAELWPSGIALASLIAREPDTLRGTRVLELGCGLGTTAIAALRAGAELLVTDYSPEALALCALNTLDHTSNEPKALQVNWRDPSPELFAAAGAGFPIVLAADVLYEARDADPLLELVERIVAPVGALWLADPGRRPAAVFLENAGKRGWTIESESCAGPWPDPEDNRKEIVVSVHRLTKGVK